MIVAVDTDVLVNWAMDGAPSHRVVRGLLEEEIGGGGRRLGVTPSVLFEFLHVTTDPRRFERPMSLAEGQRYVREIWDREDVERILPGRAVVHRAVELMARFRLGRKRILDTVLAATLEEAGVTRLLTLNGRDFAVFDFLDVVGPKRT